MPKLKRSRIYKVIVVATISFVLLGNTLQIVYAALPPIQPPSLLDNSWGRYQTDLFSGGASYSYPIKVPKGTDDLTPNVSLSYNSGGAKDPNIVAGMGWELSKDYVERDANFTPGSTTDDKFKLHFQGSTYDLVFSDSDSRWHTTIESNLNISKISTGASNDYSDYWRVVTPDGTAYRFGYTTNSEQVCHGRDFVYRWNLENVIDIHSNQIYYTYNESAGNSYLSKIEYNSDKTRVIDFTYTTGSYRRHVFPQGCDIADNSQLTDIKVSANSSLVHQFDLSYATASNSGQLLQSITEHGTSTASALPPTRFDYKPENRSIGPTRETWVNNANMDVHLEKTDVQLADVNGDSLVDIVKSEGSGNNTWKVWLNNGNGWNTTYETWVNAQPLDAHLERPDTRFIDVTGDNLPDIVKAASNGLWYVWRNTGSSWSTHREYWGDTHSYNVNLETATIGLVDVTGDGKADIIKSSDSNWDVFVNLGDHFADQPVTWSSSGITTGIDNTDLRVVDVTGDGLADIVRSTHSGTNTTWVVYNNTGNAWVNSETWINNANIDAWISKQDVTLADINGDGLLDIVASEDHVGTGDVWKALLNKGDSWSTTWTTWLDSSANVDLYLQGNTQMVDVTGDGLPDPIQTEYNGSNDTWYVWRNNTGPANLLQNVYTSQGGKITYNYSNSATPDSTNVSSSSYTGQYFNNKTLSGAPTLTRTDSTLDFNWDSGSPDGSISSDNFSARWTKTVSLSAGTYQFTTRSDDGVKVYVDGESVIDAWKDQAPTSYSGSKALTSGNHTITVEYYENDGGAEVSMSYERIGDLPFSMWLVNSMSVNNGMTNDQATTDTTTYSYTNGFYKFQDHEFRGFGEVNTAEPNGAKKTYTFGQDNASKGMLLSQLTNNSLSIPYAKLENTYSMASASGVMTVNLSDEKEYTYDGATSSAKIKRKTYQYDTYGNVTKLSELGDTSISGDERFTYNEYTASSSAWIVNTPKHTYQNAANDSTKVAESWFYYDNHSNTGDAPVLGNLTKKVDWLSGGTNPETKYTYDGWGNKTSETDPNNHTTTYTYGLSDTTRTYPERIRNAKGQDTNITYDLGTGNILSKSDPNGAVTSYTYDTFGRPEKEIKPYDSSTYATTNYSYSLDGIAPEGTLVTQREASASASTLDTYTYIDGLGRKIQTRSEAEDVTKQIVVDTYYDPLGQLLKETVPHLDTLSATYVNPLSSIRNNLMAYDVLGRLTSATNPKGDAKTIAYDHWVQTNTDENGHVNKQYFDAYDKIKKVEEVNGASTYATNYSYDTKNQLTQILDNASNSATFTYDTLGRKTQQVDPDMGTWSYVYDATGNLTSQTDNRSITTSRSYDELNRLTLINYPNDTDNTFAYDLGKIGTLSVATDSAGTVNYTYDNRLRKLSESRTMTGTTKTTSFTYDPIDRIKAQTQPDSEVLTYTNNAQGEVASVSGILTNIDYNALGKITSKTFNNGLTTNYTYNSDDFRLNRIQTGALQDLNYTYDKVGNVKSIFDDVKDNTRYFGYDSLDRLTSATQSAGFNFTYEYNSIGNLTHVDGGLDDIDYTYGQNGKPHALTSSTEEKFPPTLTVRDNWFTGDINENQWDNWGDPNTRVEDEAFKIDSEASGGYFGTETNVNYNLMESSVTNELLDAGDQDLDSWQVFPLIITQRGDDNNALFFLVSQNNKVVFTRVNGVDTYLATNAYSSTNDKYFRIRESANIVYFDTSANGTTWSNFTSTALPFPLNDVLIGQQAGTYDTESSTTTAVLDNFNTLPDTVLPAVDLTDSWSTSHINDSKWDNWGDPNVYVDNEQLRIDSETGGGYFGMESSIPYNLENSSLTNKLVDAGNQSLGSWEVFPIFVTQAGDDSNALFFYVTNNTIVSFKRVNGVDTTLHAASYNPSVHKYFRIREASGTTYLETSTDGSTWTTFTSLSDPFDMEEVIVGQQAGSWDSEASATHAIFDDFSIDPKGTYIYDNNGNMISDGTNCYQYNDANKMTKLTRCITGKVIAEYVYDFNGNRMIKKNYTNGTLANTVYSWTDAFETKVISGEGTENTSYYFVNNELVAKKDNSGTKTYIHPDHLGSASLVTNAAGTLVERTTYDAWGEVLSGATKSKFQYTGQEKDLESGLNYYNARYYDSHIKRFTQPDDVIQNIYNPQNLNRYSYVLNNPLRYTDPSGHFIVQDPKGNYIFNSPTPYYQAPAPKKTSPLDQYLAPLKTTLGTSTSTSKSPATNTNNSSGGSVNSLSGTTIRQGGPTYTKPSYLDYLPSKGYYDLNGAIGGPGLMGAGVGFQINQKRVIPYLMIGIVSPGKGIGLTYWDDEPQENSTSIDVSYTKIIPISINSSTPLNTNSRLSDTKGAVGISAPGGFSITINQTFGGIEIERKIYMR